MEGECSAESGDSVPRVTRSLQKELETSLTGTSHESEPVIATRAKRASLIAVNTEQINGRREPRAKMSITPVKQHVSKQQAVGIVARRSIFGEQADGENGGMKDSASEVSVKSECTDSVGDQWDTRSEVSASSSDVRSLSIPRAKRKRKLGTYSLLPRKRNRKQITPLKQIFGPSKGVCKSEGKNSIEERTETRLEFTVGSEVKSSSVPKAKRRRKFGTYSLFPRKRKRKQVTPHKQDLEDGTESDSQSIQDESNLDLNSTADADGELDIPPLDLNEEDGLSDHVSEHDIGVTSTPMRRNIVSKPSTPTNDFTSLAPRHSSKTAGESEDDGELLNDDEYASLLQTSGIMVARKFMSPTGKAKQIIDLRRMDTGDENVEEDNKMETSPEAENSRSPRRSGREKKPKSIAPDFANSQTVCLEGSNAGFDRVLRPKEPTVTTEHSYSHGKSKSTPSASTPSDVPPPAQRKAPITIILKKPGSQKPYMIFRNTNSELRLPKFTQSLLPARPKVSTPVPEKEEPLQGSIYTYPLGTVARLSHKRRQELFASQIPIGITSSGGLIFQEGSGTAEKPVWMEEALGKGKVLNMSGGTAAMEQDGTADNAMTPLKPCLNTVGACGSIVSGGVAARVPQSFQVHTPLNIVNSKMESGRLPLCCCRIDGGSFADMKENRYCQAFDTMDGKVVNCGNMVTNPLLARPSIRLPFMALCEVHRLRLKIHQCCPGCGRFCSQGTFFQCKKSSSTVALSVHHYHKGCEVLWEGKKCCPHCGEVSAANEVNLQMNDTYTHEKSQFAHFKKTSEDKLRARIGMSQKETMSSKPKVSSPTTYEPSVTLPLPESKLEISSAGLPLGVERGQLEDMMKLILDGGDAGEDHIDGKPRKLRPSRMLYGQAKKGSLRNILQLLMDGADPNFKFEDHDNETSLHIAAKSGHMNIVHCLVSAGANVQALDDDLWTPLMFAVEQNRFDVTNYLIKAGSHVDSKAQDGLTALHIACKEGRHDMLKLMMTSGKMDINLKDNGGWSPIVWASEHDHTDIVHYMLSLGADPSLRDNEQNTALHWAAYSGSVTIAEMYLNYGCDLEAVNERGDRPIHVAARQDHYDCVMLLIARGAQTNHRNNDDKLPIELCPNKKPGCYTALRLKQQLQKAQDPNNPPVEKVIHRDISFGRESSPIPCVNGVDNGGIPQDFKYVMENVETTPLSINNLVSSLQSCLCRNDCSSSICVCSRNSIRCWYKKDRSLVDDFPYMEPPLIFECNKACQCWMTCNNRVVQHGISVRMQLFKTVGRGWGIRTLLDIPKGTFICEYIGELISDHEADKREDDSYLFDLDNRDGETFCIDARSYGNISRFINHLCEPNLIPVKVYIEHQDLRFPRICMFASKDIKAGEELGFDYGEKFWIIKWKHFTCDCGSPKCKFSKDTIHETIADYKRRQELSPR